jgi:hypothetical protein
MSTDTIVTQPTPQIYIPPKCGMLSEIGDSQIRLGLQGPGFSGKTTGSLTFPNPAIVSLNRKVNAHKHRTDVVLIPFHDPKFVAGYASWGQQEPINRKDALIAWLRKEGVKMSPSQSLILDGASDIEESFHSWFSYHEVELAMSKRSGEIDERVRWNMAKSYFEELHLCLKSVPCNVIFICHETAVYDKDGKATGKVRPLLSGQPGDKFNTNLTDFFRSWAISKPKTDDERKRFTDKFAMAKTDLGKQYIESTPSDHETIYLWQTQGDDIVDAGTSSLKGQPKFILPTYTDFCKYRK